MIFLNKFKKKEALLAKKLFIYFNFYNYFKLNAIVTNILSEFLHFKFTVAINL